MKTIIAELKHLVGMVGHKILILDGADVVGHRVVESLLDAGCTNVRVGMRTVTEADKTTGSLLEIVPFVWENEETWPAALHDVKTVFITLPMHPTNFDTHFQAFLKDCFKNNVERVVKQSFYHAINEPGVACDGFHHVPLVHNHAICDGDLVLHRNRFDVTLLFATHLMSNVFRYGFDRKGLEDKHEFYGASAGKGVNYVSPNDVADVAVKAILEGEVPLRDNRHAFTLTGPDFITDTQVAAVLTNELGVEIHYVEKSHDFFDKDTAALENLKATGVEENLQRSDVKKVLGREPETFEDYLKATNRMSPVELEVVNKVTPTKTVEAFAETIEKPLMSAGQ